MTRLYSIAVACIAILYWPAGAADQDFNATDSYLIVNRNGEEIFIASSLMRKLNEEADTWHWTPWLRTRTEVLDNVVHEIDCASEISLESFPDNIFTDEQLRNGGFILYVLFAIYSFTLLAIVCNDFFIPCVEFICEDLKIPQNVAAATFMSVATSCPEFFVNVISTFLTMSDMGIGTIVGSAIFNLLGVAAVGGLAAITPIAIDRRPVTRDVLIYMFNVGVLVTIVWDGQVNWYEAMVLGILYILYFVLMFNSVKLFDLVDKITLYFRRKEQTNSIVTTDDKAAEDGIDNKGFKCSDSTPIAESNNTEKMPAISTDTKITPYYGHLMFPKNRTLKYKIWWLYSWPIHLVLGLSIPSPMRCRRIYPLSFIMCIIWIGVNSYLISWSMSVIGYTFNISSSVMGMTFLAFGGCLPEACSIFIMSRRGEGGIGVSNALGANSLAILFALGIPWLIKIIMLTIQGAENNVVFINSAGIDFVVGSLMLAAVLLWITLFVGKFKLRKSIGLVFSVLYVIFITFAILVETGVILYSATDFC